MRLELLRSPKNALASFDFAVPTFPMKLKLVLEPFMTGGMLSRVAILESAVIRIEVIENMPFPGLVAWCNKNHKAVRTFERLPLCCLLWAWRRSQRFLLVLAHRGDIRCLRLSTVQQVLYLGYLLVLRGGRLCRRKADRRSGRGKESRKRIRVRFSSCRRYWPWPLVRNRIRPIVRPSGHRLFRHFLAVALPIVKEFSAPRDCLA